MKYMPIWEAWKNVNIHKADHFTWGYAIFIPSYMDSVKSHSIRLPLGLEIDRMRKSIWWCTVSPYSISKMNTKKCNNERVKWVEMQKSCLFIQKAVKCTLKKKTQAYVPIHQWNYDGIKIEKSIFVCIPKKSQFIAWQYHCVWFLSCLWDGSKSISIK